MSSVGVQPTETFRKIVQLKKPIRIIQGGQGAGKTFSILMLFAYMALSKMENLIMSVVAESSPNLGSGAIRDFERILKSLGVFDQFKINKTARTYKYKSNVIEFFSVQDESSRLGSRRTHLYVNEVSQIKLKTFLEIQGRTSGFTIADYNPRKRFWIHDDYVGQPNVDFIIVTYKDNEFLPKGEVETIESYRTRAEKTGSKYWLNMWRVLGLGELGVADGLIFEEGDAWDIIEELPEGAGYIGSGLDFGFSHVTAITKLFQWNDHIILDESLFKKGMICPRIASHIKNDPILLTTPIPADSSRPEQIAELRGYGIPCLSHKKNEVLSGLDLMQSHKMLITARSKNIIREFRNYSYATDKSGESLGIPDKRSDNDNSIDAARYAFEYFLSKASHQSFNLKWVS